MSKPTSTPCPPAPSRLQFGGYATARDTVKAFVRDPNPTGAAVDLATGRLFITSRRLRA